MAILLSGIFATRIKFKAKAEPNFLSPTLRVTMRLVSELRQEVTVMMQNQNGFNAVNQPAR